MIVNARGALHTGSVAYVLARLAAVGGDHAAADQLYQHAAQHDEHAGAPGWVLRDLHHHRDFLRAVGQHERADVLAQRAQGLAGAIKSTASREG